MGEWPEDWAELTQGIGCGMCGNDRPEADRYGIRILRGRYTDAYLRRGDVRHGYSLVIWRGGHVNEPTKVDETEAAGCWAEVPGRRPGSDPGLCAAEDESRDDRQFLASSAYSPGAPVHW